MTLGFPNGTPRLSPPLAKVPHICELQLKFVPIHLAVETGGSHEHYEYFRSYFSGGDRAAVQKRMALLDKLGSSDSVESFVGEALKDSGDTVAEPTYFPGHMSSPALAIAG